MMNWSKLAKSSVMLVTRFSSTRQNDITDSVIPD